MKPISHIFKFAEKQRPSTSLTPEEMREYKRQWAKANREVLKKQGHDNRVENSKRKKEWLDRRKKEDPEWYATYKAGERKRSAQKRKKLQKSPKQYEAYLKKKADQLRKWRWSKKK